MKLNKDTRIIIVVIVLIFTLFAYWQILTPWFSEKNYRDGFVANSQGQYLRSIQYLNRCMELTPWETYYQITQVRNYEALSRQEASIDKQKEWLIKARDLYSYMLDINPENPWYWNGIASIYLNLFNITSNQEARMEVFDLAGEAYRMASEIDFFNPLFQMSYGFYLHRKGEVEEAYKYYLKCTELDSWYVEAFYRLAEIEISRGNYDKAIEFLEDMATADRETFSPSTGEYSHWVKGGNFSNYRQKLAELYFSHKKNTSKAIEYYLWSLQHKDNDPEVWKRLGMAYHQDNQLERAIRSYRNSISLDPNQEEVYKYLAYLYYNIGHFNSSLENFNKYFRTNNSDQKARQDYERIKNLLRNSGKR
jgi:tetratricopeptide (TPR) repeat protein